MNIVNKAREFAIKAHNAVNQKYDNQPYEVHLKMVSEFASQFQYLLKDDDLEIAQASAWLHDTLEDIYFISYNDIKKEFGEQIAEAVYALTNEKGRTRKDRANAKYYQGIRDIPVARFVKVCDRLANASYSISNDSSMVNAYRKENEEFNRELYCDELKPMFDYLNQILK
jgi:(p)ppGpp synthase/HD superfamily hydrolase